MKRSVQLVGILIVLLLAAQPVLGSLPCGVRARAACAVACPMTMDGMGPDCPMASQMAATDCPESCCQHTRPTITTPPAAPEKFRLIALAPAIAHLAVEIETSQAPVFHATGGTRFTSPPRYILNQVFRI